jgi:hypothetical protein
MFPALPRYDECERGMVEHACRIVVYRTRKQYLYPATHYASTTLASQTNVPAMGQRLRLKSSFFIPDTWSVEEKAILRGLKKYGALVADNGNFFSVSVTPDDRWPATAFNHLSSIGITNFEVVQSTGPTGGPRSPGAPSAHAGPDQSAALGTSVQLGGFVNFTGAAPVILWKLYSGPATVSFGNATQTNTYVSFSMPGTYTLMLSADDGVHAVAYDAMSVTVTSSPTLHATVQGTNLNLSWTGGSPPFVLEVTSALPSSSWVPVSTNNGSSLVLPASKTAAFFRLWSN